MNEEQRMTYEERDIVLDKYMITNRKKINDRGMIIWNKIVKKTISVWRLKYLNKMNVDQKLQTNTFPIHANPIVHDNNLLVVKNVSDKPYKVLQTLHNAQIGVRVPNRLLIHAVDQYLKYLRNETTKVCFYF